MQAFEILACLDQLQRNVDAGFVLDLDVVAQRRVVVAPCLDGEDMPADALGYEVFFADRATMLEKGEYRDLARSLVRLWGFTDNLKEMVLQGSSTAELKAAAIKQNMMTLRMAGIGKVLDGVTTTEEILRVTMAD